MGETKLKILEKLEKELTELKIKRKYASEKDIPYSYYPYEKNKKLKKVLKITILELPRLKEYLDKEIKSKKKEIELIRLEMIDEIKTIKNKRDKSYEMPTHDFDYEKIKEYAYKMNTDDAIIYLNYILKEFYREKRENTFLYWNMDEIFNFNPVIELDDKTKIDIPAFVEWEYIWAKIRNKKENFPMNIQGEIEFIKKKGEKIKIETMPKFEFNFDKIIEYAAELDDDLKYRYYLELNIELKRIINAFRMTEFKRFDGNMYFGLKEFRGSVDYILNNEKCPELNEIVEKKLNTLDEKSAEKDFKRIITFIEFDLMIESRRLEKTRELIEYEIEYHERVQNINNKNTDKIKSNDEEIKYLKTKGLNEKIEKKEKGIEEKIYNAIAYWENFPNEEMIGMNKSEQIDMAIRELKNYVGPLRKAEIIGNISDEKIDTKNAEKLNKYLNESLAKLKEGKNNLIVELTIEKDRGKKNEINEELDTEKKQRAKIKEYLADNNINLNEDYNLNINKLALDITKYYYPELKGYERKYKKESIRQELMAMRKGKS